MALPLIIAGIGAALVGAAGVALYASWKGRSIAILGPRGSGKTTLCEFLRSGEVSASPSHTIRTTKHKITEPLKIKDLDLNISEIEDLSGDTGEYTEWKSSIARNSTIFYLVRADLITDNDEQYVKRVLQDTKHIGEWIEEHQKELHIIGTHCDNILDFDNKSQNLNAVFSDKINKNITIKKIRSYLGGRKKSKIHFGVLTSKEACEDLVRDIFSGEHS